MTKISDLVAASVVDPADIRFGVDQTDLSETRQLSLDALQKAGQLRVVDSIVQLLLVTNPRDGQIFQTKGYTTPGDGGGNLYRYDIASAATVDNGWVINGPSSVGRYLAIDTSVANVKQFGARGDSATDDSSAIQAAIDAAESIYGGVVFFPPVASTALPSAGYRCNVTVDAARGVTLRGAGNRSILWSFAAGDWAVKIEGTNYSRQTSIENIDFFGNGKVADGLYINGVTNFSLRDTSFSGCGIGLCINSTIVNQLENCNFYQNYVGLFLTSATGANTSITDIAGRTVTITNRIGSSHSGAQYLTNFRFQQNDCAIFQEQPDIPAANRTSAILLTGGLIENNSIGIWLAEGGHQASGPMHLDTVWFETNDGPAITVNGYNSSARADIEAYAGRIVVTGHGPSELRISGQAIVEFQSPAFHAQAFVDRDRTGSVVADNVIGHQANLWELYADSVQNEDIGISAASAIHTAHKTRLTTGFDDHLLYSKTCRPSSSLDLWGTPTKTTVADGLFDQPGCAEISTSTAGHGVRVCFGATTTAGDRGVLTWAIKGIFAAPAGVTVDAGTDVFTSASHGYANNGRVVFGTDGTLPAPLVSGVEYWLRDVTTNTFKVSLTRGGTALNITDAGSGSHTVERVMFELSLQNTDVGAIALGTRLFPVYPQWRTYAVAGINMAGGNANMVIATPAGDAIETWRMSGFQTLRFDTMREVAEFQRSNVFAMSSSETLYSSGAGSPSGVLTPTFIGQDYLDTTGDAWYRSTGLTNTDWQAL